MAKKRKGPKQRWEVGAQVKLGGREYIVAGEMPPPEPGSGLAQGWVLDTLDHSKTYEYIPWQGLRLIRGDLVRPARAARRKAARAAAKAAKARQAMPPPPTADKVGFLRGLLARFRPGVKRTESGPKPPSPNDAGRAIRHKARQG